MKRLIPCFLAAMSSACFSGLTVPDSAQLSCSEPDGCPTGFRCAVEFGVCVSTDASAEQALVVPESVTVSPLRATRGVEVTLSFEVQGAVANAPSVAVEWNGGRRDAELRSAPTGPTFEYVYTVGADEAEGPASLVIDVQSASRIPSRREIPRA
ncbi:MAG: hypothetical protein AAFQ82_13605, partial [Myxococcota bacterium]